MCRARGLNPAGSRESLIERLRENVSTPPALPLATFLPVHSAAAAACVHWPRWRTQGHTRTNRPPPRPPRHPADAGHGQPVSIARRFKWLCMWGQSDLFCAAVASSWAAAGPERCPACLLQGAGGGVQWRALPLGDGQRRQCQRCGSRRRQEQQLQPPARYAHSWQAASLGGRAGMGHWVFGKVRNPRLATG